MGIGEKFKDFCNNLSIDTDKRETISSRYKRITKQLNIDFYGSTSETNNSKYVGSYGRDTAIDSFSDLDMIFILPYEKYKQYNDYSSNGQSALLQEVKKSIKNTYSVTESKGDGQVVVVSFKDNIDFEIVPVFVNKDGSYTFADSNNGGRWKVTNPNPEIEEIRVKNIEYNYNLKNLCKMIRTWKNTNDVPMGGLLIDTFAERFLRDWKNKDKSFLFYDYMVRDFFKYISEMDKTTEYWLALGSKQYIYRKGNFESKAKTAYNLTLKAIEYEEKEQEYSANQNWKEIFGGSF